MLDDPGFARNLKAEALSSVHDPRLLCALIDETVALAQVGRKPRAPQLSEGRDGVHRCATVHFADKRDKDN